MTWQSGAHNFTANQVQTKVMTKCTQYEMSLWRDQGTFIEQGMKRKEKMGVQEGLGYILGYSANIGKRKHLAGVSVGRYR